ncbi:MAG: gliding motility-associated ABC transporter ATP-binding subunit GldA [Bacteroidia bacterium]|nr:gliding motility-associated ABC transporter ATP-binding subunit GldA [Bacteroidia bacterium]
MISVSHLTKVYGEQKAVNDLSFSVEKGQILGFLGPNGAGKSTTMKILTGFISATEGHVEVAGFSVAEQPLEVRKRVGYLPENNPLYLDMYVHEFLDYSARMYRMGSKERKQRIAEVIEQTGLGREQHKQIRMLSKGYRQRVGLSQALIHNPEVLILDEPTTGLDPNQIVDIRSLIREVGKDKTVIFSSHVLSEVEAISDRIVIVNRGHLVANASMAELRESAQEDTLISLEVEKPGLDLTALHEQEQVLVKQLNERSYSIFSPNQVDLRREIFDLCQKQDNAIFSLNRKASSLEDIFRKLTQTPS